MARRSGPDLVRRRALVRALNEQASKYKAVSTTVDGLTFASKKEARRYGELKLLEKAKKIDRLELQRVFPLSVNHDPEWPDEDDVIGKYVADFSYYDVETGTGGRPLSGTSASDGLVCDRIGG